MPEEYYSFQILPKGMACLPSIVEDIRLAFSSVGIPILKDKITNHPEYGKLPRSYRFKTTLNEDKVRPLIDDAFDLLGGWERCYSCEKIPMFL